MVCIVVGAVLLVENVSFSGDAKFAESVDTALERVEAWVAEHKTDILERRNSALFQMLRECNDAKANPLFEDLIETFMAARMRPRCWKNLVDPNWPVDKIELNIAIKKETLDNKWVLYAMAPEKAEISAEEMELFAPDKWRRRRLTHQIDALIKL